MKIIELLSEVQIDNDNGWGAVPFNADIDYFGLRVLMKPSVFLKLAAPLPEPSSKENIKKHLQNGGSIGAPFLDITIPPQWEDGDFTKAARVRGHEGRNRMAAVMALEGDAPVEVHLIPGGGMRNRDITPDMIKALNVVLYPEGMTVKTMDGPYFTQYNSNNNK